MFTQEKRKDDSDDVPPPALLRQVGVDSDLGGVPFSRQPVPPLSPVRASALSVALESERESERKKATEREREREMAARKALKNPDLLNSDDEDFEGESSSVLAGSR